MNDIANIVVVNDDASRLLALQLLCACCEKSWNLLQLYIATHTQRARAC